MKRSIVFLSVAAVALILGIIGYNYVWPKLSLFYPEHRVERFRSLSSAFPARPVKAAAGAQALPEALAPIVSSYQYRGIERQLDAFLERSATTAFIVIKDGTIVHEAYFQGNTEEDLVTSFSVAKSIVSTLVGVAIDEGLIESVNDPITKYVPDLVASGFDGVPIIDTLTMSSGVDFSEKYDDETTDAFTIYNKLFLHFRPITEVIKDYGSRRAAGQKFEYASINTQSLGQLVEAVSDMSIADYLSAKIWQPMGATRDANWTTDNYGNVLAFWGLNATARDFAKFAVLISNQGAGAGKQIVSADWIGRATSASAQRLGRGQIDQHWGYGYQWWLPKGSATDFAAIGIWGQFIYVDPASKTVIVKFSADPNFKQHEPEAIAAFRAIAQNYPR